MFIYFRHNDLSAQYRERTKNQVYTIDLTKDVNSQAAWEDKVGGVIGHTDIPKLRAGMVGAQVIEIYSVLG